MKIKKLRLENANIKSAQGFYDAMKYNKDNNVEDEFLQTVNIVSKTLHISKEEVYTYNHSEVNSLLVQIVELFTKEDSKVLDLEKYKTIRIKGKLFGIEPILEKIELGAFIDLETLQQDVTANLHKIMAVLYRPVVDEKEKYYKITSYVYEDDRVKAEREELFLNYFPYNVVRSIVNFTLEYTQKQQ